MSKKRWQLKLLNGKNIGHPRNETEKAWAERHYSGVMWEEIADAKPDEQIQRPTDETGRDQLSLQG